jgi:WXG100 family type VII secretion target
MSIESMSIMVQDGLAAAAAQLNGYAEAIVEELNGLINQLEPIAATWTGPAASYYGPLQQEWNFAAGGLFGPEGVLGEIANALRITWNNYSDAEWANVNTWQGAGSAPAAVGNSGAQ